MKAKTIKSILRKKINEWLATITDEEVRKLAEKNTIVTGGSIVSMLMGEQVNDYDIYFKTQDAAFAVAEYYINEFKKTHGGDTIPIYVERTHGTPAERDEFGTVITPAVEGRVKVIVTSDGIVEEGGTEEYAEPTSYSEIVSSADDVPAEAIDESKPDYRPVFISANAITLSNRIQLVMRFIGEPDTIHKFYDFVHCTCYWTSWNGELVLPAAALEAIITKELRYVGSLYPLCSIIRIRKFVARGWQINAGQVLKMCMQLNSMDLRDLATLEDQLTGVDAFYFMQVIKRLKDEQEKNGTVGQPIDGTYLMTIIDRIF